MIVRKVDAMMIMENHLNEILALCKSAPTGKRLLIAINRNGECEYEIVTPDMAKAWQDSGLITHVCIIKPKANMREIDVLQQITAWYECEQ